MTTLRAASSKEEAMQEIRVFIIDGDVVVRQMLACLLRSRPDMLVCGITSDGQAARAMIARTRPNVVLLDLEGLETDSLQLLSDIHEAFPTLPIIALSTRSQSGARQAIKALERGAAEFLTKPEGSGNVLFATRHLCKRLAPAIKAVVSTQVGNGVPLSNPDRSLPRPRISGRRRIDLVVIGGGTGGPHALFSLLPRLPEDLPVPVLIVQHMPKRYTAALAERLALKSRRLVAEGRVGALLEPGQVWIAPGGYHMTVSRSGHADLLDIHRGSREHGCRPSIDVLFRAAADQYGPHVLGVVLSGHSLDGFQGSRHIHNAGGQILVEDEPGALVWEGPGAVVRAGLAEKALSQEALAKEITRRVQAGRSDAAISTTIVPERDSRARQETALLYPGAARIPH